MSTKIEFTEATQDMLDNASPVSRDTAFIHACIEARVEKIKVSVLREEVKQYKLGVSNEIATAVYDWLKAGQTIPMILTNMAKERDRLAEKAKNKRAEKAKKEKEEKDIKDGLLTEMEECSSVTVVPVDTMIQELERVYLLPSKAVKKSIRSLIERLQTIEAVPVEK